MITNRRRISQSRQRNHAEIIIISILALLPLLFFWRLLAPNPMDRLGVAAGDFTEQYFPLRAFTAGEWVAGRIPFWNPALFGGQPALADPQSGALYLPHILEALILGWSGIGFPLWALEWQVIGHFSWVAVGAYLLGRHWAAQISPCPHVQRVMGLVLSITLTYSGYLTGFPVQQITILQVSAWLPWVMWGLSATIVTVQEGYPIWDILARMAWTAIAFAMAILAGHPQTVMYIFYLGGVYIIFLGAIRGVSQRPDDDKQVGLSSRHSTPRQSRLLQKYPTFLLWWGRRAIPSFLIGAISIGLGCLIATAQIWPTLEFINHSLRADLAFETVAQGLPLNEIVSILYPGFLGGSPEYVGILPLVLIAVALTIGPARLRSRIYFWLGIGLAAIVLAFGANTFLYPVFYLIVPGFGLVRQQERIFLLYSFAASVLAGYGALSLCLPLKYATKQVWQRFRHQLHRMALVAVAVTGLFIYGATVASERGDPVNLFFGVLRHHIFGLIILGGTLIFLALRPHRLWRRGWGLSLISLWLIFNLFSVNWRFNLHPRDNPPLFTSVETSQFLIEHTAQASQPVRIVSGGYLPGGNNAASVFGLEDVTGNTPLQLANVAAFAKQMPAWRFWQLMNVLYVVDERDIDGPGLARRYEASGLKVFEVGDPFPRARVVHAVIAADDWTLLAQERMDMKKTALVPDEHRLRLTTPAEPSTALITDSQPGYLSVTIEAEAEGLLVLSNIDYPGWQAWLNGTKTEIIRTNGIFQGIAVPAGHHQVTLTFVPNRFWQGLWISGGSLVLVLGMILVGGIKKLSLRSER